MQGIFYWEMLEHIEKMHFKKRKRMNRTHMT